jgi:hypothetical protein
MTTVDSVAGPRMAVSRRLAPLIGKEVRHLARHPVLWLVPPVVVVTASLDGPAAGGTQATGTAPSSLPSRSLPP